MSEGAGPIKLPTITRSNSAGAPDRRAANDLAVMTAICVIMAGLSMRFQLINQAVNWTKAATDFNLDGIIALLIVVPIATTIFARRRYNDVLAVRKELVRLSLHDALTGLPNRRLLTDWLAEDIQRSQDRNSQAAVLFVDLDKFKYVNDTHGHEVGDRLMRAVADRLREALRAEDRVVRFGGDEFVILCPEINGAAAAEKLATRIVQVIEHPFRVGDEAMRISASVGVALAEHRGVKPEEVLRDADVAMYQAKAHGSGKVTIFDRSMTGTLTPATAEEQIRNALEGGEFQLYYQPVVDLQTGRVIGAEALLRWNSKDKGMVSPGDFIPILEETGLIIPVGTWVLEEACRQAARLRTLLPDGPPIAITANVSARQLSQVGFADIVANALSTAGVGDGQIHLEITEGALMRDVGSAWAVLRQAKALGVKLALDDFGTGYSSLSYIRRFSLDMLKIDKSFIDGIDSSPEDRAIVQHVVGLAKALGMVTVAEGVERPEQIVWLERLGCRLAQGYVLSRPIPASELEELLLKRSVEPFPIAAMTAGHEPLDVVPDAPTPQVERESGAAFWDPEKPAWTPPAGAPANEAVLAATPGMPGEPSASGLLPRMREYRPPVDEISS